MSVAEQVVRDPEGITAERAWIIPPFPEAEFQVSDGRTLDRDLSVMPGRPFAVHRRHGLTLLVAMMVGVIAPAVAQVDATNEGNVAVTVSWVADHDELLVMGAAKPHTLVEKDFAPG
jgi:hypothetical protein